MSHHRVSKFRESSQFGRTLGLPRVGLLRLDLLPRLGLLPRLVGALLLGLQLWAQQPVAWAQSPILDRKPFDIIELPEGKQRIEPLPFREMPASRPRGMLEVRLLGQIDDVYEVEWLKVKGIEFYEQIVMAEAQGLVAKGDFDAAFDYFAVLLKRFPKTPGLDEAVQYYLYMNAGKWFQEGRLQEALGVVEELYARNPKFQPSESARSTVDVMSLIAQRILDGYVEAKDYDAARLLLQRLEKNYPGEKLECVRNATQTLSAAAGALRDEARQLLADKKYRDAQRVSREMVKIWPQVEGGADLLGDIARTYPVVTVAVTQKSPVTDRNSLDNWAARRTGHLVQRNLMEFLRIGPEFGEYECPLGKSRQSYDRRTFTIRVDPDNAPGITGPDLMRQLRTMADPGSATYDPGWASLMRRVGVRDVYQVEISLRQPHIRPESLLQLDLAPAVGRAGKPVGHFIPLEEKASPETPFDDTHYVANPDDPFPPYRSPDLVPPSEVIERLYAGSQEAIQALRRGEVDAIDRLFPADAAELLEDPSVEVVPYSQPVLHMLVPNYDRPFTERDLFRRGLLYGIRRQAILDELLLRNRKLPGCQLISGPFAIGLNANDPAGYAYDEEILPRGYDPRSAIILTKLAERQLEKMARTRKEEPPKMPTLKIGHPADEVSRIACQAIAFQLNALKIKCELKEFPAGETRDTEHECDLVYVQAVALEPISDARKLLSVDGIAGIKDDHINRGLRWLDNSRSDREVRNRLKELHRVLHESVAVIPLWQTVEYFAHRKGLSRAISRPSSLYQDIGRWQLAPTVIHTAGR